MTCDCGFPHGTEKHGARCENCGGVIRIEGLSDELLFRGYQRYVLSRVLKETTMENRIHIFLNYLVLKVVVGQPFTKKEYFRLLSYYLQGVQ